MKGRAILSEAGKLASGLIDHHLILDDNVFFKELVYARCIPAPDRPALLPIRAIEISLRVDGCDAIFDMS